MKLYVLPVLLFSWLVLAERSQAADPEQVKQLLETKNCAQCDLSGADLKDTNLKGADLRSANLKGANLKGANLRGANLSFTNLEESDLTNSDLSLTKLFVTSLNGAKLDNAKLGSAKTFFADFSGVSLNAADLFGTDLRNVQNLTLEQVKTAKNWEKANYGNELTQQLSLPAKPIAY